MKTTLTQSLNKAIKNRDTKEVSLTIASIIGKFKNHFTLQELVDLSPAEYRDVIKSVYLKTDYKDITPPLKEVQWIVSGRTALDVSEETVFNLQIKELRKEIKTSMKKIDGGRIDPRITEVVTKSMNALRAELKLMIEVTDGETPSVTSMSDALDGDGDVEVEVAPVSEEEIVPADSTPTVSSHSWSALLMSDLVSAIEKPGFVTSGLNPSARKFLVEAVTSPSYAGMVDSYTVLSVVKTLATSNHRGLQNWVKSGGLLVDTAIKNFK
jgi:hypothetical protein